MRDEEEEKLRQKALLLRLADQESWTTGDMFDLRDAIKAYFAEPPKQAAPERPRYNPDGSVRPLIELDEIAREASERMSAANISRQAREDMAIFRRHWTRDE